MTEKKPRGRPPKTASPRIPDSMQNVVQSLVKQRSAGERAAMRGKPS